MTLNNDITIAAFSPRSPNPVVIAQVNHVNISNGPSPIETSQGSTKAVPDPTKAGEKPVPQTPVPEGITLYSNDGCPGCSLTARAFDRAGLQYTEVNLADRPDLVELFKQEGLTSLPIIKDGQGQTVSGYRPDRIKAIIDAGRPPVPANSKTGNAGEPVKPIVASKNVNAGVEAPRASQ